MGGWAYGEALDGRQLALGARRPGDGLSDGIVDDAPALAQADLGLAIAI